MPFDILDQLRTLPYLAIANVFSRLPVTYAFFLERCAHAEFREHAGYRKWQRVCVGSRDRWQGGDSCGYGLIAKDGCIRDDTRRDYFQLTPHEFFTMVMGETPPPFRIQRLLYVTNSKRDLLFMTSIWWEYVATHVRAVELDTDLSDLDFRALPVVLRHLDQINIVGMRLTSNCVALSLLWTRLEGKMLPTILQLLTIDTNSHLPSPDLFVIPDSVAHLDFSFSTTTPFRNIPKLPPRLKTFRCRGPSVGDITSDIDCFPALLEMLEFCGGHRPAYISQAGLLRFSKQLRHNLFVYDEGGEFDPNAVCVNHHLKRIDLNFSSEMRIMHTVPPAGYRLKIHGSLDPNTQPSLMTPWALSRWFRRADSLELVHPLPWRQLRIPSRLEVAVEATTATITPDMWDIPRITLLTLKVTENSGRLQLDQLKFLKELRLTLNGQIEEVLLPAPPNIEKMSLYLTNSSAFPNILRFDSLRTLEVFMTLKMHWILPSYLPPNLVRLKLAGALKREPDREGTPETINLSTLVHLQTLELSMFRNLDMAALDLPDSLRILTCYFIQPLLLENASFPPQLEILALRNCRITNPWLSGKQGWFLSKQPVPIAYPDSLHTLDLRNNAGLVPPPADYVFPPHLRHMDVSDCKITDVSGFRFPASLRHLDMSYNDVPAPEACDWPPLQLLTWKTNPSQQSAAQKWYNRLQKALPSTRICE